jgi:hypothetical protein
MDSNKIQNAISKTLNLLYNEVENIEFIDLKNEYLLVIKELESVLKEINQNE